MVAGLPASCPFCHSEPVESKNCFICAQGVPKRVGKANTSASASTNCSAVMIGWSLGFAGADIFSSTTSGSVSGTCKAGPHWSAMR